jgi:hypothetical protein
MIMAFNSFGWIFMDCPILGDFCDQVVMWEWKHKFAEYMTQPGTTSFHWIDTKVITTFPIANPQKMAEISLTRVVSILNMSQEI